MDIKAYSYFYKQVQYDLINGKIPELEYPNHKDNVLGLCITNMHIKLLEEETMTIDYLLTNYKKYVPAKHVKKHSIVLKKKISDVLYKFKNVNHDLL